MQIILSFITLTLLGFTLGAKCKCVRPITTASGPAVINNGNFCAGDLIFEDNFNSLDDGKWEHEITLAGGGNWEFQWYVNDRSNSYTQDGVLHIRPTLTSEIYGENFLTSGTLNLGAECTNNDHNGCQRTGSPDYILNPVRSARLRTLDKFNFKYGRVEVRAKLPAGDWLWPAIWMLPSRWVYGGWPRSGEVDIMESRGNRNLLVNGSPIGPESMGQTLHFGPDTNTNGWPSSHYDKNTPPGKGYHLDFHRYQLEWTPDKITFKVDGNETGTVWVGDGFWNRGGFSKNTPWFANPWINAPKDAPFDQEFHILINLAIGGTAYFPDNAWNPDRKPWSNDSPQAMTTFWSGRDAWLKTWNYYNSKWNTDAHFQIDYVKVWAV